MQLVAQRLDLGLADRPVFGLGHLDDLVEIVTLDLAGSFLAAGLVDELLLYVAPVMLGERARPLFEGLHIDAMTERLNMRIVETRRIGEDVRVLLRPRQDGSGPQTGSSASPQ